jgi:hypothetical protein
VRATAETEAKTYAFSIPYKNLPLKEHDRELEGGVGYDTDFSVS